MGFALSATTRHSITNKTISNVTETAANYKSCSDLLSGLQPVQFLILAICGGLTIEVSFSGMLTTIARVFHDDKGNFWKLAIIMTVFNISCIVNSVSASVSYVTVQYGCKYIHDLANVASHFMYVSYDAFILIKTYYISKKNKYVMYGCLAIVINRCVWTIIDIAKSGGVYDNVAKVCTYYQYPISGVGYNAADLICDAFCTICALYFNWKLLFVSVATLVRVIVKENLLRSAVMLSVNSYLLWASLYVTDTMTLYTAYAIQTYSYTRCLNLELFWMEERKNAMKEAERSSLYFKNEAASKPVKNADGGSGQKSEKEIKKTRRI